MQSYFLEILIWINFAVSKILIRLSQKKLAKLCSKLSVRRPDMLSRMNKKCWKALISVTKQGSGWFSHFDPPTRITKVSRWDWTRILERLILLISRNDDFFVKKKKRTKKNTQHLFSMLLFTGFFHRDNENYREQA